MIHKLVKVRGADFCDDQFPVISTIGRGPRGEKGDKGDTVKFADPVEWNSENTYEPLIIVLHEGSSYVSKQAVPKGIDITNEEYWALTYNYNVQVEQYRHETMEYKEEVEGISEKIPAADFTAENTVKDYIDRAIINDIYYDVSEPVYGNYENTTYMYVKVGKDVPIKAAYAPNESLVEYATSRHTTVTCNAGLNGGLVITDGEVVHFQTATTPYLEFLCFNNETGDVFSFPNGTPAQTILDSGATEAVVAYYKNVINGSPADFESMDLEETNYDINPRTGFFVDRSGDKYFIATNGRTSGDIGLTPSQFADLIISLGGYQGWNLDGGGSTTLLYKGARLTRGYDDNGLDVRNIQVNLSVPEKIENENAEMLNDTINEKVNSVIKMTIADAMRQAVLFDGKSLNDINFNGFYCVDNCLDAPYEGASGFLIVITTKNAHGATRAAQVFYSVTSGEVWARRKNNSIWQVWHRIDVATLLKNSNNLPNATDINTIVDVGRYAVITNSSATTMVNWPFPASGTLYVTSANQDMFVNQIAINSIGNLIYTRRVRVSDSTATDWAKVSHVSKSVTEDVSILRNSYFAAPSPIVDTDTIVSASANGYVLLPFRGNQGAWFIKAFTATSFAAVEDGISIPDVHIIYE